MKYVHNHIQKIIDHRNNYPDETIQLFSYMKTLMQLFHEKINCKDFLNMKFYGPELTWEQFKKLNKNNDYLSCPDKEHTVEGYLSKIHIDLVHIMKKDDNYNLDYYPNVLNLIYNRNNSLEQFLDILIELDDSFNINSMKYVEIIENEPILIFSEKFVFTNRTNLSYETTKEEFKKHLEYLIINMKVHNLYDY